MTDDHHPHALRDMRLPYALLPYGAVGIDAGLTMTKSARGIDGGVELRAGETAGFDITHVAGAACVGVTGARVPTGIEGAHAIQEIEAAARGVGALLAIEDERENDGWLLALLGTGTAFAAVREGRVTHLGGTPLGGGSFAGIARQIDPSLTYETMVAAAARGDRRNADMMVSDAYPEGIGRIGPDLTAAHLARADGKPRDDVLAALLNLHGENIAQIAASRATIAQLKRIVLAGGFAHNNPALVASITAMAALFGVQVRTVPAPGFAGAIGAALIAADPGGTT